MASARRIVLTGGSGFIGSQTIPPLLARGFEVHAISRTPPRERHGNVVWHQADLLEPPSTKPVLESIRASHLLHLAWTTEHGAYWNDSSNLDWMAATLALVRSFQSCGGSRVVLAGTCAEYDWTRPISGPFRETDSGRAHTFYGRVKAATYEACADFASVSGLSLTSGRIFFPFGAGEPKERLVPSVIRALLDGREAECTHGQQRRDFIDVRDCGAAFAALADSDVAGVVNIGTGTSTTIGEIAHSIGELMGRQDLIRLGALPARPDDPPSIVADTSRLNSEVGFRPEIPLAQGLRDAVNWWTHRRNND